MKAIRMISLLLALVTCAMCFAACGDEEEGEDTRTINVYEASGDEKPEGSSGNINIFTEGGELAFAEIDDFKSAVRLTPQKEGFIFGGWYSDEGLTNRINPASPTKAQISKGTAYAKWLPVETQSYYIRSGSEVTITDSGRANQQLDKVNLSSDYKIRDLINSGYEKLEITVSADIMERDDGYQYIFLYSDSRCADNSINSIMDAFDKYVFDKNEGDPSLLYMQRFTHGGDGKNSIWGTVSFTVIIDANRLTDDLYIRYGASGKYDDDWCNKNICVEITPIK